MWIYCRYSDSKSTFKVAADVLNRVLVANRGEIARRVFRTCRTLGLSTAAVYSDADAGSPYVAEADVAVRLPGTASADTYLRADLLIEAALRCGSDAVHPGYGFLSENAAFASAVQTAGLTWIGPPPAAIEAMGSKTRAKQLMAAAGVPVLPQLEPDALTDADLPVLIKASAGGGGRGMRVVRTLAELPGELAAARSEAASAFGDPAVFCETYLPRGRHIEVQILADGAGTVWAVGERECSIQRRHQKIIEEAPSPLVQRLPAMREQLFDAARAAAEAVGYVSAGTVEFLADDDGRFWFLEMNTRLQVEHPVTEATTGLDLVALQLGIAAGQALSVAALSVAALSVAALSVAALPVAALPVAELPTPGSWPAVRGHAIEARLYAEDPAVGWQPQSGTLHRFEVPGVRAEFQTATSPGGRPPVPPAGTDAGGPVLRLDSGVRSGSEVGIYYDPMLAKVICWAPDREQAAAALATALARARIHGLTTNRDLLVRVLRHPAFRAGQTDTAFLDEHGLTELAAPLADEDARRLSALAAALADAAARQAKAKVLSGLPPGWRNVPSQLQRKHYALPGASGTSDSFGRYEVGYRLTRDGLVTDGVDADGLGADGLGADSSGDVRLVSMAPGLVELEVAGLLYRFEVATYPGLACIDSALGPVTLEPVSRFTDPASQAAAGSLLAPMPGTVVRVGVSAGERVTAGQPLLWLEAMKMEHVIAAPAAGVVIELPAAPGQQVDVGSVLAVVKPHEGAERTE